jgi:transporter family-2 protein
MVKFSAFLSGILIIFVNYFNSVMGQESSVFFAASYYHVSGFVIFSIILLLRKESFIDFKNLQLRYYLPGLFSVFTILIASFTMPVIGATMLMAFNLIGQTITSNLIDHFGLLGMPKRPLEKKKLIGYSIILLGIIIMFL